MSPEDDLPIQEVRAARHAISARFQHDPEMIVAYYGEFQRQYADRLLTEANESDQAERPETSLPFSLPSVPPSPDRNLGESSLP